MAGGSKHRKRNRAFDETHALLISTAIRLVSEKGIESISLSEVARAASVNRTTVYYHFASREELFDSVRGWSSDQLAAAFAPTLGKNEKTRQIVRFVMENPQVMALWADDFLAPGEVTTRYPEWNALVGSVTAQLQQRPGASEIDPEAYCTLMLAWTMLGPRVFRNSVRPDLPLDEAIERMTRTQAALLEIHGIVGA
jgi:AcrR family transcriptional regulator